MKNLVLSSILLLLVCSCSISHYNSFQRTSETVIDINSIVPWFGGDIDHFLFRTNIDIYNSHFGGIMIIKSLSVGSHRVIYITELGIKIFDMEFFKNGEFKLHYCLDAINRKSIVKTLKNDIGIMIENIPGKNKIKFWKDTQNGEVLIRSKDRTGIKYHIVNDKTNLVEEILLNNCWQKKMNLFFYSKNGIDLDSVKIKNYNINLNIQLSHLNEIKSDVP